jgi:pSer/pThr/pTyr-binding forkhead associated (FHA) protein
MASIMIMSGERKGDYYPLGRRTNVIGRAESLLIQVLDDQISRRHLQIRYDSDSQSYSALDMSSKNGVFINGSKMKAEVALSDGDSLVLGSTELLFTDQDFDDAERALHHFKKVGERARPTFLGDADDKR